MREGEGVTVKIKKGQTEVTEKGACYFCAKKQKIKHISTFAKKILIPIALIILGSIYRFIFLVLVKGKHISCGCLQRQ